MRYRFLFIGLVLASGAAFILGCVGFSQADPGRSWLSNAYLAAQLFTLESGSTVEPPTRTLEAARWLAPLSALSGLLAAIAWTWQRLRNRLGAWRLHQHTIVCGDSELARQLLAELQQRPGEAVAVIDGGSDAAVPFAFGSAATVAIQGPAAQPATWRRAQVQRAQRVVCVASADAVNLQHALVAVESLPHDLPRVPVEVFVYVQDLPTRDIYQRSEMLETAGERARVRLVNPFWNRARVTWDRYPLECITRPIPDHRSPPQLILPGLDPNALAFLVQAARIGHYRNGLRLRVELLSAQLDRDVALLQRFYPGLTHCLELNPRAIPDPFAFWEQAEQCVQDSPTETCTTIVTPNLPDFDPLASALVALERCRGTPREVRWLVEPRSDAEIRWLDKQAQAKPELKPRLAFLPRLIDCNGSDATFTERLDRVARVIHESWLRDESGGQQSTNGGGLANRKPAGKAWEDLSESQRDLNRYAADHVVVKLRAAGLDPLQPGLETRWRELDAATLEALARMEHERWAAQLWLAGWTYHPTRNDAARQHPNLCPYDALDESTRELDRQQVRKAAGYWSKYQERS